MAGALDSRETEDTRPGRSGILVELFTSQGCSSCPPADRLLSELAAREDLEVIPLSFHVDYWNYIGWTDPFSSAAWSQRQRRYAEVLGGNRVYTPQIVIDGRWEGVGSERSTISRLIARARAEPRRLEIGVSAEWASQDRLQVAVAVSGFEAPAGAEGWVPWVAVVESDLETPVGRGENASKTLRNDRVVRRLERVPGLASVSGPVTGSVEISVEDSWRHDRLSVVAFLQNADSLRIGAVAESTPSR